MFPLEKPYKLLYSINALITCIREEILEVRERAIDNPPPLHAEN